jgi:hypothetical protein
MWNRQGNPQRHWILTYPLGRACVALCLVFVLGIGGPFYVGGLVSVQWLLAPETAPLSEESSTAELAAPRSSLHPRLARARAQAP